MIYYSSGEAWITVNVRIVLIVAGASFTNGFSIEHEIIIHQLLRGRHGIDTGANREARDRKYFMILQIRNVLQIEDHFLVESILREEQTFITGEEARSSIGVGV